MNIDSIEVFVDQAILHYDLTNKYVYTWNGSCTLQVFKPKSERNYNSFGDWEAFDICTLPNKVESFEQAKVLIMKWIEYLKEAHPYYFGHP